MKLSYNWLADFVDLDGIKLDDLAENLTMKAFEVEEIKPFRKIIDPKVVLGEILEITKHPDADKLQVTKTTIGSETLQIVCGATNIQVGQKVPVATVGAAVTNRHDASELKITKSKIRGVESFGMLCSPAELGLDIDSDGIYILNDFTAKLGTPISQVLGQEQDYIIEVGARSNRGDALSVLGQARELAAVLDRKFNDRTITSVQFDKSVPVIEPKIANIDDCKLFYTVAINNVSIRQSPQWLQDRINAMGIKSINNVVDISNFVLLEMGQPMHFYDRDRLKGSVLTVRRAKAKETITTLEERTHELSEINLVIADTASPVSLAGVMGGLDSAISDQTRNIVIEVAVFNPATVRRSARAAGVESESKRRFERGVDLSHSKQALFRAIELLVEHASPTGAKLQVGEIQMAGAEQAKQTIVTLRIEQVKHILGVDLSEDAIVALLAKLQIKKVSSKSGQIEFSVPFFRVNDITREIDLIEEIARIYGYDAIPVRVPGTSVSVVASHEVVRQSTPKSILIAAGFSEAILSSLIGDTLACLDEQSDLLLHGTVDTLRVEMDNPLSVEHRVLRKTMLPGLLQAAARNYAYDRSADIKLFEFGKIYSLNKSAKPVREDVIEKANIAAVMVLNETSWAQKDLADNFYQFKTIVENLFPEAKFSSLTEVQAVLHPGISAEIKIKERGKEIKVGVIGKIHPSLAKAWDLPPETYLFETASPQAKQIKFKPIANTPIVERDITVDSTLDLTAQSVIDLLTKHTSKDLVQITIVSVYHRETSKSTSFRLKWQSETETLSGELIDKEISDLKALLGQELNVTFRE